MQQVQQDIISTLRSKAANAEEISMVELLDEMQTRHHLSIDVRVAMLPLISRGEVELTEERKLRLKPIDASSAGHAR